MSSVTWVMPALLAAQAVSGGVSAAAELHAGEDGAGAEVATTHPTADADETDAQPSAAEAAPPWRAQNTWTGSTGGVRVIDGASGSPGSLRFQLGFDYFGTSNFLQPGDTHRATSGTLSLSATPIEHLELFGAVTSRASSNDSGNPILLQSAGDFSLGAKGYVRVLPWLSVGADLRAMLLNTIGDVGIKASGTSAALRVAATADFRRLAALRLPAILRANVGYVLDNSAKLIEDTENARYNALSTASRRARADEDRHLVNRIERFGLGINRVDMMKLGLGIEVPLQLAQELYVQPLAEWQLGIPVNRQHFDCLAVPTDATLNSADSCLAVEGLKAAPSTLTLGVRVLPPVRGLSALVAFDIGLLGTSTFVRELAPTRPWAVLVSVGYAAEPQAPSAQVRYVERRVEVAPAAPAEHASLRVRGEVVERGTSKPIIGAVVRYADRDFTPQLTSADGLFVSYALPRDATQLALEITHPDYESGHCVVPLGSAPPAAAPEQPRSTLTPLAAHPEAAAPAAQSHLAVHGGSAVGASGDRMIHARCELTALPQSSKLIGAVTDAAGKPLAGVELQLKGPAERTLTSGPSGEFDAEGLPPGDYTVQVDNPQYLFKSESVSVITGSDASVRLSLTPRPNVAQALLTTREIRIGAQVVFPPNGAEVDARSAALLDEVVDVLAHNPQVRVQVQGHTDNSGDAEQNQLLSQQRADSVKQYLVDAGIDASRLEAKGFGAEQPLVPNLTPENRARNRRVQFVLIKE